jgi:iron(III) transport system substrate-binding protein
MKIKGGNNMSISKNILLLVCSVGFLAVSYSTVSAANWQQVTKAAKAEGKVALYLAKSNAQAKALLTAFEKKFGIKGTWLRGSARAQSARLRGELKAGKPQADVFYTAGPISHSGIAKITKIWVPDGPNAKNWPKEYMFPHGSAQMTADPVVIIYNTNKVKPAPTDYKDMIAKKYITAVGSPASVFRTAYYYKTRKLLGEGFWKSIAKAGIVTGPSVNALIQGVAAGETDISLAFAWQAAGLKRKGAPINWVTPKSKIWALTQWAMALESGPSPNAGKLLLDYMMGSEGQAILNTDGGVSVIGKGSIPANVNEEEMTAQLAINLTKWWEKTFHKAIPQ